MEVGELGMETRGKASGSKVVTEEASSKGVVSVNPWIRSGSSSGKCMEAWGCVTLDGRSTRVSSDTVSCVPWDGCSTASP